MVYFSKILLAFACVGCLYLMKVTIVEYIFHYACLLYPEGFGYSEQQITGSVILNVIDLSLSRLPFC